MESVNKEAVRMLVQDVGYAIASDQLGIPQPTLRQWAKRGQWNATRPHAQAVTTVTRSPAEAQADIIKRNGSETRLALARYTRNAAGAIHKSVHPAKWTKEAHDIAKTASIVHGWNEQQGQAQFSLNVLNLGGSVQIGVKHDSVDAVAHTRELEDEQTD